MTPILEPLIEALREELKQYGEMLALLDQQQEFVLSRAVDEVLSTVSAVNLQSATVQQARHHREQCQHELAATFQLPCSASFLQIIPALPEDYRPLIQALVHENNELLLRIQRRVRQNHLLLSRCLDLMQRFMNTLFPGLRPTLYTGTGSLLSATIPPTARYEAVG
jgi:flagellar biosynthesis/type III secretory pathway chaperone